MAKMKNIVKKWQRLARVGKVYTTMDIGTHSPENSDCEGEGDRTVPAGCEVVYVGESRRRYVINCRHLEHPLFKALQERSKDSGVDQSQGLTLGCEVVLFEHLLWMLDSDDPSIKQAESVHELAELYMPPSGNGAAFLRLLDDQ